MPTQQQPPADLAPQNGAAIQSPTRRSAPDPSTAAATYLKSTRQENIPTLAFWRGSWLRWRAGAYRVVSHHEVRADLVRWLATRSPPLTSSFTRNVLHCLQALALIPGWVEQPSWRDEEEPNPPNCPAGEMLATPTQLLHLPGFAATPQDGATAPPTSVSLPPAPTAPAETTPTTTIPARRDDAPPTAPRRARRKSKIPTAKPVAPRGHNKSKTKRGQPAAAPPPANDPQPALPPQALSLFWHHPGECHEVIPPPHLASSETTDSPHDRHLPGDRPTTPSHPPPAPPNTSPIPFAIPATPRFFNATALDFDFDEHAPPPREWLRFLASLWRDDQQSISLLQDWFGYLLTPDTSHQKILLVVGPRRSGKGTIARVARALVGHANVAAPTLTGLAGRFGLWPLVGKSLAIIPDARLSGRVEGSLVVERLLSTSGEDLQTVERKNLEPVTVRLPTRLMILTNELPRLKDSSGALVSRLLLLRMERTFLEREDRALVTKLLAELPRILRWAIVGWQRLRQRGYFVQPDAGLDLLEELDHLSSPVSAFLKERCEVGCDEWHTVANDLFAAWRAWCRENGRRDSGNVQSFGRQLKALLPTLRTTYPRRIDGRRRVYVGIRLEKFEVY